MVNHDRILITGGAGYLGSHAAATLLEDGFEVCLLDNFSNSVPETPDKIRALTGKAVNLVSVDLLDFTSTVKAIRDFKPNSVLHFAALKSVADSVIRPIEYYENNVVGTINLLKAMSSVGCDQLVFSSSATVYDVSKSDALIREDHPIGPCSPYGKTKAIIEDLLRDWSLLGGKVFALRYFNPIGVHPSGLLKEEPLNQQANLLPAVLETFYGESDALHIFGNQYPTRDGTGERDFIHVMDLVDAHITCVKNFDKCEGFSAYNIGTGRGTTVLELLTLFNEITKFSVPFVIRDDRPGDVATAVADVSKIHNELGWRATRSLADALKSVTSQPKHQFKDSK